MKSSRTAAATVLALILFGPGASGDPTPALPPPGCQIASKTVTNANVVFIAGAPGVVTSTVDVVALAGEILDVDVYTNLQHERSDDLDITLTSPSGTVVTLTSDNGGATANAFAGTWWDDQAGPGGQVPYSSNAAMVTDSPYAALPLPAVSPEEPLGAFVGEPAEGTWTLTVSDDALFNGGALLGWTLVVRTVPPSALEIVNVSTPVVVPIPGGPTVVSSTLQVPPQASPVTLQHLRARTHLSHTIPAALDVTLTSPSGTVVTLTSDNGGNAADAFQDTTWRDDADPGGALPYATNQGLVTDRDYSILEISNTLAPEEALAAFDGEDPTGIWTLTVSADDVVGSGSLNGWSLRLLAVTACYGRGSFDSDGAEDLVLRRLSDNSHVIWHMRGSERIDEVTVDPPLAAGQRLVGTGRFLPGWQLADLVVQEAATGAVEFWDMQSDGQRFGAPAPLTGADPLPANWKLSSTGDFNHDGFTDLVWRNLTSQKIVVWTLGQFGAPGTHKTGNIIPSPDQAVHANWAIVATVDFDGDNNTDFLWYNATSGKIVVWFMDANVVRLTGTFTSPDSAGNANWKVVAAGDYGPAPGLLNASDGIPDIVWRNETSGKLVVWSMDGGTSPPTRIAGGFTTPDSPQPDPLDWNVAGPR